MRYLLSVLLYAVVFLVALWTTSALYHSKALDGTPQKALTADIPNEAKARLINSLSSLNTSLALNPGDSGYWYSRSKLIELGRLALPSGWRDHSWEEDLSRAIVRSPADAPPILRLANTCAAGYGYLATVINNGCDGLFKAVMARAPQSGYVNFRYAEYLYTQALGNPNQRQTFANSVCKKYGQALNELADTRMLRSWHENQAFYNCTNLAFNMNQILTMEPNTKHQWYLLGQEIGRKGESFWCRNQGTATAYLRDRKAPLADYDGLANGLAKTSSPVYGADVLHAYTAYHPQDGLGWEAFIRYLDKNKDSLRSELVEPALIEANQKANLELSYGLYFLGKACQLKNQGLVGSLFYKLVALNRESPEVYAAMARCQFSLGYMPKSIDYFLQAIRLSPGSPKLHIELGRVYAANKQFDQAIDEFQRALDLKPGDKAAKREMRRMGIYEK